MTTVRQRLRKHLSPLAADTITTLNLPPVRMGLLTKLNLLTVGLIALTALTITSFYIWQQWRDDQQQLRSQGRTVLAMLAELSAPALATPNKAGVEQMLSGIAVDSDIAYVVVHDQKGAPVAERRIATTLGDEPLPAFEAARRRRTPKRASSARSAVCVSTSSQDRSSRRPAVRRSAMSASACRRTANSRIFAIICWAR